MTSVVNPSTPYVGPIPGGLQKNTKITISGLPEHHHNQFTVALQAGSCREPRSDAAFWFNPRFNENWVVRNTLQMGSWGSEERHGGFPFQKGVPVEVTILVKKHHYKVSVNGQNFTDYTHRLGIERVSHLVIEEGFKVNYIRFEPKETGTESHKILQPTSNKQTKAAFGIDMGSMFGGLLPGFKFTCSGLDPSEFASKEPSAPQPTVALGPYPSSSGPYPVPSSGPYPASSSGPYPAPSSGPYPSPSSGPYPTHSAGSYPMPYQMPGSSGPYPQSTPGPYPAPGMGPYPTPAPGPYQSYPNTGNKSYPGYSEGGPIFNPPVPSAHRIPGGLDEGKVINLSGTPHQGASRFNVNLISGSDIALHLDVRFNYGRDKNVVITNEQKSGRWGIEKREFFVFDFPFAFNQMFDMSVKVEWDVFRVTVNGKELLWTFHKIKPLSKIDTVKIEGDVAISQICFQ